MRFLLSILLAMGMVGISSAEVLLVPTQHETIQDGIDAAADSGDVVLVMPGEYEENIDFNGKKVFVLGAAGAGFTTINGGADGPCVTFNSQETVSSILSGFTLTGGSGNNGRGGGVFVSGSMPMIFLNTFLENEADNGGAAVYATMGVPTLMRNLFLRNSTDGAGGGIHLAASAAIILNNTFIANESAAEGAALYAGSGIGIQFINNIVAHNSSGRGANIHAAWMVARVSAGYNDVWGNDGDAYSNVQAGDGAISTDPLFVNEDEDDFHLTEDSPCIDAGDPNNMNDIDGSRADIGCYSYLQAGNMEAVTAEPDTVDFGTVYIDSDSVVTVTLNNPNEEDNEIDVGLSLAPNSPYSVEDTVVTVAGGEEVELEITFTPTEDEDYSDVLMMISTNTISLGDTLEVPIPVGVSTISLNGRGVALNVKERLELPYFSDLISCHPNPFNSTLEIQVNPEHTNDISLQIYNLNGRKICDVYSGISTKGRNIYQWTPENISAGLYVIQLTTSNGKFELPVQYLK